MYFTLTQRAPVVNPHSSWTVLGSANHKGRQRKMPYVNKAKSPLLRQYLMQRRGMGQADNSIPIDTSALDTLPGYDPSLLSNADLNTLNLNAVPLSTVTPSSSGFNLTNLFNSITNAAVAGQKIYLSSQMPSLVPGTQAVYNPGTGQYYNPTTGQVVNAPGTPGTTSTLFPAGLSTANYGPILMIGGLLIGGVVLLSMFRH